MMVLLGLEVQVLLHACRQEQHHVKLPIELSPSRELPLRAVVARGGRVDIGSTRWRCSTPAPLIAYECSATWATKGTKIRTRARIRAPPLAPSAPFQGRNEHDYSVFTVKTNMQISDLGALELLLCDRLGKGLGLCSLDEGGADL